MSQKRETFKRDWIPGEGVTVDGHTVSAEAGGGGTLGPPGSCDYASGLFTDIDEDTLVGNFACRVNQVLKLLAPGPAPNLADISISDNGVEGDVTWGASHAISGYSDVGALGAEPALDINETFENGGQRRGIFNDSTTINGVVAGAVDGTGQSYPNDAFDVGDGTAEGTLEIRVNEGTADEVTWSVALNVSTPSSSQNTNGTGFTSISAATSVQTPLGEDFDLFKYRTANWTVDPDDMRNGWNFVRVVHTIGGSDRETNYYEWIVDDSIFPSTYVAGNWPTSGQPVMAGTLNLSGVTYHTSGTATFTTGCQWHKSNTIDRTNWEMLGTRCTVVSPPNANDVSAPSWQLGIDQFVGLAVTINGAGGRLIGQNIGVQVRARRTVQTELQDVLRSSTYDMLMDSNTSSATQNTLEDFRGENWRLHTGATAFGFNDINAGDETNLGPSHWDSTQDVSDSGIANYDDGLQVTNDKLVEPGADFGDYGGISDGPAGNPDYSTGVTGTRYYMRAWIRPSGSSSTFRVNFDGSGTFIAGTTAFTTSTNQIKFWIKLPTQTGWMDATQDFSTDQWNDNDGCLDQSGGNPGSNFSNWDLSVGTKATVNSGDRVYMLIAVPEGWTGNLSNITWTFN